MRSATALPRPACLVATTLLVGLVGVVGMPAPAGALTQPQIISDENHTAISRDYPPIGAQFPTEGVLIPTPGACGPSGSDPDTSASDSAPAFEASCDRIPLKIVPPKHLDPVDDYIIQIALSWNDPVGGAASSSGTGNDMDLYIYDATQKEHQKDPTNTSPSYTQMTSSASSKNPESVKIGHADLINYNIVVVNTSGQNLGYTIKITYTIAKGDKIFELLDSSSKKATDTSEAPPVDLSAAPAFAPSIAPGLADLGLGTPDLQLDATNFGPSTLNQQLAAPPAELVGIKAKPPAPASGVALLLWLVVLPLGLLGASLIVLARRGTLGSKLG